MLYYNDLLWSGQALSDFVHSDKNIPEEAVDLARIQTGSNWITKKLKGTLHDIYTIPKFEDLSDIIEFIKTLEGETWKSHTEWKEGVIRDLVLAYTLAVKYLKKEGYYVPKMGGDPKNSTELLRIAHKWEKFTSPKDRIWYCTLLKEVLWFFRIIRFKDFTVDYGTWIIDLRNKDFIKSIMDIFNSDRFYYNWDNTVRYSNESAEMRGTIIEDGMEVPIYAGFDVKTIDAVIEKMDGQEKYNLPEAFSDIHRMRIEVPNLDGILRIWKILFEEFWWLEVENVGWLLSEEDISSYSEQFLTTERTQAYKIALLNTLVKNAGKKKAYSEDRKELKLKWWKPPIEIQIVLVNNHNETGYAHHDIYKIRRKIAAKIRRHWWIWSNWINTIISMVFENNRLKNKWALTIPFTEEQIREHIVWLKWFLIPIRWASEWEHKWDMKKLRINHWTTKEVLEKYSHNYPEATKKDPVSVLLEDANTGFRSLVWISQLYNASSSTR